MTESFFKGKRKLADPCEDFHPREKEPEEGEKNARVNVFKKKPAPKKRGGNNPERSQLLKDDALEAAQAHAEHHDAED